MNVRDPHAARRPRGPGNRWELVWSHRDELLEMARSRSASAEEAEDAVQEAMIRAVEDPGVPYGRVRPWLRRATLRACADRRREIARDAEVRDSLSAAPADPFLVEEMACDRAEARWLAARSAELLPARQAEALRLHSQDLDVGQVAGVMGLSYRATESLLARARRSLRTALAGALTLTMTLWLSARRFPRTGVGQQAVATSAAVTVAVVGLALPADSVRPGERTVPDGPGCAAPRAVGSPVPRVARGRSAAPGASPDTIGPTVRETSLPMARNARGADAPANSTVVEVGIAFGTGGSVRRPVALSASIPARPVDPPAVDSPKALLVPVDISAEAAGGAGSEDVAASAGSNGGAVSAGSSGGAGSAEAALTLPAPSGANRR